MRDRVIYSAEGIFKICKYQYFILKNNNNREYLFFHLKLITLTQS